MVWFVEPLEIRKGDERTGRWRLTATSDEGGGGPFGDETHDHPSPTEAQACAKCRLFCDRITGIPSPMAPVERPPLQLSVNDPTMIKIHVQACISSLRDEDGRTKTRELALAVTKLQEAVMWIDEHQRLN